MPASRGPASRGPACRSDERGRTCLSERVRSFPSFFISGAEVRIIINLKPLAVHPTPHTQCHSGLCSLSQVVGGGGRYDCSHCPPKGTEAQAVKERGRDAARGHPPGRGDLWARGTCLIPGPVWVGLCSKSQQPTEHSWKRQSHRTGVKVALPDFSS